MIFGIKVYDVYFVGRCTTTRNVHTMKRALLPVLRFWSKPANVLIFTNTLAVIITKNKQR